MKKKPPKSSQKGDKAEKKETGKKKYLVPLITTLSVAAMTEEVMAKCKCEPIDDSASNYF
jgi:hypothetical protein